MILYKWKLREQKELLEINLLKKNMTAEKKNSEEGLREYPPKIKK